MVIDLNCDLGESYGIYRLGADEDLLHIVTSINVACGFHAGDPQVMRRTVELARNAGVAVGAHPGYPDRVGFGRRAMQLSRRELEADLTYQIGALAGFTRIYGTRLHHVKLHGALYNQAMVDERIAEAVTAAVAAFDAGLFIYTQPESALEESCRKKGLKSVAEAFADRRYDERGRLVARSSPGAVIEDAGQAVTQAVRLAVEQKVETVSGGKIPLRAGTICLHGDHPKAVDLARRIRAALEGEGVELCAP